MKMSNWNTPEKKLVNGRYEKLMMCGYGWVDRDTRKGMVGYGCMGMGVGGYGYGWVWVGRQKYAQVNFYLECFFLFYTGHVHADHAYARVS